MSESNNFYKVYFAGGLFNNKELFGNAILSDEIYKISTGKFACTLPQNIEFRDFSPRSIRDVDIITLLESDLAIFNFDGAELDSGTVVEFMFAKFADIPSLIIRSDFRLAGDCVEDKTVESYPWNLMAAFYPRTLSLIENSAKLYKKIFTSLPEKGNSNSEGGASAQTNGRATQAAILANEKFAKMIVEKLEELLSLPPQMPENLRENVYKWLGKMPEFSAEGGAEKILAALEHKIAKKLL